MRGIRGASILLSCLMLSVLGFGQATVPAAEGAISLSVLVTDSAGRSITGLATGDFRLLENQVEQKIVSVKENTLPGDYTLTYMPSNTAKDGTLRRVAVEIVHPGIPKLLVRHSLAYRADPE